MLQDVAMSSCFFNMMLHEHSTVMFFQSFWCGDSERPAQEYAAGSGHRKGLRCDFARYTWTCIMIDIVHYIYIYMSNLLP